MSCSPNDNGSNLSDEKNEIIDAYKRSSGHSETKEEKKEKVHFDRQGFVCKSPDLSSPNEEDSMLSSKWWKIFKNWDKVYPSAKIRKLAFKGLPSSIRGEVWKHILGIQKLVVANKGVYMNLLSRAHKESKDAKQIDIDINRTFRNHEMFYERYGLKQKELFNVLFAYTVHNKEVGYCQGMSSIAALLLMYMTEEECFWSLSTLLTGQKYNMHGCFIENFPKVKMFCYDHDKMMEKMLPSLFEHFKKQTMASELYALRWFMLCFIDQVPFALVLRLWDVFISEGDKILHPIAYTLLKVYKKTLMKMATDEIAMFLSRGIQDLECDEDHFMDGLFVNVKVLRKGGCYPAPSIVKGELPLNVNPTSKNGGRSSQRHPNGSGSNTGNDNNLDVNSNVSRAEYVLSDVTTISPTNNNFNLRSSGLHPEIPILPKYEAPEPKVLKFVKIKGKIRLVFKNVFKTNKDSKKTTHEMHDEQGSANYDVSKIEENQSKTESPVSGVAVAGTLEEVEVDHKFSDHLSSDTSDVDK